MAHLLALDVLLLPGDLTIIIIIIKSEISSFWLLSVLVQPGLCQTCSETTLLVFPRGGSNVGILTFIDHLNIIPENSKHV